MMRGFGSKINMPIALIVLLLAAVPLRGQSMEGYEFETGVDSSLWVDMSDAQFYPYFNGSAIDIGFPFYFCGRTYCTLSVEDTGAVLTFGEERNNYPTPVRAMLDSPNPIMSPYGVDLRITQHRRKVVGSVGHRISVVELYIDPPQPRYLPNRVIQVQLFEEDGSVVYLYGERPVAWPGLTFVIGMKGVFENSIYVDTGNSMTSTYTTWTSAQRDWPGAYRYYRFRPCCMAPQHIDNVNFVTEEQATISWRRSVGDSCYQFSYRPADSSQDWSTYIVTDTFITLTGLPPLTKYEGRVSTICTAGCASPVVPFTFLTFCPEEEGNKIRFASLLSDSVICGASFLGWSGSVFGRSDSVGVVDYGPESMGSRHTVHIDKNERDPRTGYQLRTIPEGHCMSVRLGNWLSGAESESITYIMKVDTNRYDLLILRYAIVEENPEHPPEGQPKFLISITDTSGQLIDSCYYANFVSGVGDSLWNHLPINEHLLWRDWTAVGIDLAPLHGQTIYVRLDNYDCAAGAHYGYSYFTLESGYKRMRSAYCGHTETNVFYAPDGFSYRWYRADNPGVTLGTDDSLVVTEGGQYFCRASYLTGDSSCGFTLSAFAGPRYPVADFAIVPKDTCGFSLGFENHSYIARDSAHTQPTSEPCEQYLWRFSDGTISTATNLTRTFEEGTYTVELVAMLADGQCRDSMTHTFTVSYVHDTVVESFCVGDSYAFYGEEYDQPGFYTVTDGCNHHALLLSVRPLPAADYEVSRECGGEVFYYLNGTYREADSAYYGPGSVAFVGEDGLIYRWSMFPQDRALPYLGDDGRVRFDVTEQTQYYLLYQYADSPACPQTDTLQLAPLKPIEADLEVHPEWLGYDNMELTALDRSRYAEGRRWLVDGVEQGEEGSIFYYEVSPDADSVRVGVVAYNDICSDTAEKVVPVLRHMLAFPNVFTPGQAGNNLFGPIGSNVTDYELWIFDRRGVLIFHSTDLEDRWDGTSNGIVCRQESYAYTCSYTTPTNDRLTIIGTVTLLR